MGSSSLARLIMASLGVSALIAMGCGGTPPTAPPPIPGPTVTPGPEASPSQRLAALALFEAASMHAALATMLLTYGTDNGKVVWTDGPCSFEQGAMRASLDGGAAPPPGTFLPTGSHTFAMSFSNCPVNYWGGEAFELNGIASAAYTVADWRDITVTVSVDSMRGQEMGGRVLNNVTADGSAVWTRSSNQSTTYTPTPGSRLVNDSTNNVATFGGGAYSLIVQNGRTYRFVNLQIAVSGSQYTLDGSLVENSTQPSLTYSGEIRIINNGTVVARIYGTGGNAMRVEVMVPLIAF